MGKRTYFQRYLSQQSPQDPINDSEQQMTSSEPDARQATEEKVEDAHLNKRITNTPVQQAVHEGWSRVSRYFMGALVLMISIWFIYVARGLAAPLVISGLVAWLLYPIVEFFNRRTKLPRTLIVVITYLVALGGIIYGLSNFLPLLVNQTTIFTSEIVLVSEELRMALNEQIDGAGIDFVIPPFDGDYLNALNIDGVQISSIVDIFQAASANLAWLFVILVTSFYLLKDWDGLREWAYNYVPPKHQSDITQLYRQVARVWQGYLRGQFRLMIIVGFLSGLGAALVGLPGAVGIGIMAGVFDALPTLGPLIAAAIATLVAFFQGSAILDLPNAWFAVLIFSIFIVVQFVENIWLRPRIMGQSTRLHPAIVFVGFMASLTLASILVTLVIIPLIATLGVIGRYLYCRIADIDPWAT